MVTAIEKERPSTSPRSRTANAKLLAHLADLAFDKIPRDPGNPSFRQGGTLGSNRKHWFRAKTGNGRYRLFYRFQSTAKIIVYAWVNDAETLRTRGSDSDAYEVFAKMLDKGAPPDYWTNLLAGASTARSRARLRSINKHRK